MTKVYYNEFDPNAAAWLRELAREGLIPDGEIDTRSICDVQPADVMGFDQCHFFAGIGGWAYALQLAGWGDRPVFSGSCPCQPFSAVGKRKGVEDDRHLWPEFRRLIAECRPPTVFGEQVASKAAKEWGDAVQDDLESLGYAFGAAVLPACSIGAVHRRSRLYFVAHADCPRLQDWSETRQDQEELGSIKQGTGVVELFARHVPVCEWKHQPCLGSGVHGVPGRMGAIKAYGNAVVPKVADEFIKAYMEATCPAATH